MTYSVSDHIRAWFDDNEGWASYDPDSKKWDWLENYEDDTECGHVVGLIEDYQPYDIAYEPVDVAKQIDDWYVLNKDYPHCYAVYVSPEGHWFPTIYAAFMWYYEGRVFKKILEEAFLAGVEHETAFDDFWSTYGHH
jgi:hypothetical protein